MPGRNRQARVLVGQAMWHQARVISGRTSWTAGPSLARPARPGLQAPAWTSHDPRQAPARVRASEARRRHRMYRTLHLRLPKKKQRKCPGKRPTKVKSAETTANTVEDVLPKSFIAPPTRVGVVWGESSARALWVPGRSPCPERPHDTTRTGYLQQVVCGHGVRVFLSWE